MSRVFGRDSRAAVVGGVAASFSNLVLLGLPLVIGVYGQAGVEVLSLLIMVHLPIMIAATIVLFARLDTAPGASSPGTIALQFFRIFLSNPLIIGILAGIFWRLTGWPIPGLARPIVDALASVAGPVALFAVGLGLVQFGIKGAIGPALALAPLKLVVMPTVVAGPLPCLFRPAAPDRQRFAVIGCGRCPTCVNTYLNATRFGTGQALASNVMTLTHGGRTRG